MTLMAGFDLVIEISKVTLLKLTKKKMQISGVSVNPPFELNIPITSDVTGIMHVVVNNLLLDLEGDRNLKLTMEFSNTSIILSSPKKLTIAALDGKIISTAAVKLTGTTLVSDFGAATTQVNFTTAAEKKYQVP